MKVALFCRGECGRQTAYVKRPPGSTLKTKYFGFCNECKWMIKWGCGVKEPILNSHPFVTRNAAVDKLNKKTTEFRFELMKKLLT